MFKRTLNGDGTFTKLANLGGIQNIGYDGGSNFVVSGDFNGDGKTDFIRQDKGGWDDDLINSFNIIFVAN